MRLLKIADDGSLSFTHDLPDGKIPPYAILSHTWGPPADEVLYHDILDGSGLAKAGFRKIRFCAEQAQRDGLNHIWVDTCCINKPNLTELQEAINSMFKWYTKAVVCYVWLPDVSRKGCDRDVEAEERLNNRMRKSRWFTRGWTLQELIAPKDVVFYSKEWTKVGDKTSLQALISEITKIPAEALRGKPLEQFSITERLSWQDSRQTTKEEDKAYALMGICSATMLLNYGEGQAKAFQRLRDEIDNNTKGRKRPEFELPFAVDDVIGVENFVARRKELQEMREKLSSNGSRQTVVVHGLGGIGKTQLMIAYAKRHRSDYSAIFWLNAKDNDSMKASFTNIARQILQVQPDARGLGGLESAANADVAVNAVKNWLCLPGNTRWLMLFDNLDNPKIHGNTDTAAVDFRAFLPSAQHGFVAVTTRSSRLDIDHQINLQKLENAEESLKILSDFSKREISVETTSALDLTKKLDGLPLALATAGAYLRQSSMDLTEYLHWHDNAWAKLQQTSPGLSSYQDRMLYSTWQVSFDQIERVNPLAANLLRLWAYFDNQDLWYELLCHGDEERYTRPQWLTEVLQDKLTFEEAVRVVRDHGLVEPHPSPFEVQESAGYSIHSCVHSWTRMALNPGGNNELAPVALGCITVYTLRCGGKLWRKNERLLGHALWIARDHLGQPPLGLTLAHAMAGMLWASLGRASESERALDIAWEELESTDDLEFKLLVAESLALVCQRLFKFSKAETFMRKVLDEQERVFGTQHATTLHTMSRLADVLWQRGQLGQAKDLLHRAFQGQEHIGLDQVETFSTYEIQAQICLELGEFDEAERLLRQALHGYETRAKPGQACSQETVDAMASLAEVYAASNKPSMAENMMMQVIQYREKTHGSDSVLTLLSFCSLGVLLGEQERYSQGEAVLLHALKRFEAKIGLEHTETLRGPVPALANLYKKQSRLVEAEKLFLRALEGLTSALGKDNEITIKAVNSLGWLYEEQGRFEEAERMALQVLKWSEVAWGPVHVWTLRYPVLNLALVYEGQGETKKAEELYLRALQGLGAFGRGAKIDDGDVAAAMSNLGKIYYTQGRLEEAEEVLLQALCAYESVYGSGHVETLRYPVKNLGILYAHQGKLEKAQPMYRRVMAARERMPVESQALIDGLGKDIRRLCGQQWTQASSTTRTDYATLKSQHGLNRLKSWFKARTEAMSGQSSQRY